jgi:hypothetical protein
MLTKFAIKNIECFPSKLKAKISNSEIFVNIEKKSILEYLKNLDENSEVCNVTMSDYIYIEFLDQE